MGGREEGRGGDRQSEGLASVGILSPTETILQGNGDAGTCSSVSDRNPKQFSKSKQKKYDKP